MLVFFVSLIINFTVGALVLLFSGVAPQTAKTLYMPRAILLNLDSGLTSFHQRIACLDVWEGITV